MIRAEVIFSADVFVTNIGRGLFSHSGALNQVVFQDRFNAFVTESVDLKSSGAGRFQPGTGIGFRKTQDTQTRTVGLINVPARMKKSVDALLGGRSDLAGPAHKTFRRPVFVFPMMGRHVAVGSDVFSCQMTTWM